MHIAVVLTIFKENHDVRVLLFMAEGVKVDHPDNIPVLGCRENVRSGLGGDWTDSSGDDLWSGALRPGPQHGVPSLPFWEDSTCTWTNSSGDDCANSVFF